MEAIVFYALLFSVLSTTIKGKRERVVGMTIENPNIYPFFAQLLLRKSNLANFQRFCGATLVHPRCILTAAHCLPSHSFDRKVLREGNLGSVYMGTVIKLDRQHGQYTKITNFTIHRNYSYKEVSSKEIFAMNDIAVCQLKDSFRLNENVQVIALDSSKLREKFRGQVVGIGEKNTENSAFLTALSVDVQDHPPPQVKYQTPNGAYTMHDLKYTGYPTEGDSGGPLITTVDGTETKIQVGVFSHITQISPTAYVAHYESVRHHLKFIKAAVNKWCGAVEVYGGYIPHKRVVQKPTGNLKNNRVKSQSNNCAAINLSLLFWIIFLLCAG